jgi:hypothetical protein
VLIWGAAFIPPPDPPAPPVPVVVLVVPDPVVLVVPDPVVLGPPVVADVPPDPVVATDVEGLPGGAEFVSESLEHATTLETKRTSAVQGMNREKQERLSLRMVVVPEQLLGFRKKLIELGACFGRSHCRQRGLVHPWCFVRACETRRARPAKR